MRQILFEMVQLLMGAFRKKLLGLLAVALIAQIGAWPAIAGDKGSGETALPGLVSADPKGEPGSKQAQVTALAPLEIHMDFVRDNVTATIYHELAHAFIEMLNVPVLGQEEDAADVLSAVMINIRHPETEARRIARHSLQAFSNEADTMDARGEQPTLWDEHGPARQRYYNTACIFVGAEPDGRMEFSQEMGLPDSRADYCGAEYEMAAGSWVPILDRLRQGKGQDIGFRDKSRSPLGRAAAESLANLVASLNADYSMPENLEIMLKRCGSADRGYEAYFSEFFEGENSITVCTEYVRDLYRTASGQM